LSAGLHDREYYGHVCACCRALCRAVWIVGVFGTPKFQGFCARYWPGLSEDLRSDVLAAIFRSNLLGRVTFPLYFFLFLTCFGVNISDPCAAFDWHLATQAHEVFSRRMMSMAGSLFYWRFNVLFFPLRLLLFFLFLAELLSGLFSTNFWASAGSDRIRVIAPLRRSFRWLRGVVILHCRYI